LHNSTNVNDFSVKNFSRCRNDADQKRRIARSVSFQNLFAFGCAGFHTQSPSFVTQSTPGRNSPAAPQTDCQMLPPVWTTPE
jgi:hypothetical protein